MILSPSTTTVTITAHAPVRFGSDASRTASVTFDVASGTWSAAAPGGSMGWVTRALDASRGAALLHRTEQFVADGARQIPGTGTTSSLEITTDTAGTRTFAVDTLLAQQLVRDVFAATGRPQTHGRVVRHEVAR